MQNAILHVTDNENSAELLIKLAKDVLTFYTIRNKPFWNKIHCVLFY